MKLIDGTALLKYFTVSVSGTRYPIRDCDNFLIDVHLKDVQERIRKAPAIDAVPIVRCKDCKYRDDVSAQTHVWCAQMQDDDFCSRGEKREKGSDDVADD